MDREKLKKLSITTETLADDHIMSAVFVIWEGIARSGQAGGARVEEILGKYGTKKVFDSYMVIANKKYNELAVNRAVETGEPIGEVYDMINDSFRLARKLIEKKYEIEELDEFFEMKSLIDEGLMSAPYESLEDLIEAIKFADKKAEAVIKEVLVEQNICEM